MGSAIKSISSLVSDANMNPEIKLALEHFPVEMMEKQLGRALTPLEASALPRELEVRGINQNPAPLADQQKLFGLISELLKKQDDMKKNVIQNMR